MSNYSTRPANTREHVHGKLRPMKEDDRADFWFHFWVRSFMIAGSIGVISFGIYMS